MLEALQGSDGDREMGKWNIDTLIDVCTGCCVCVVGAEGSAEESYTEWRIWFKNKNIGKEVLKYT